MILAGSPSCQTLSKDWGYQVVQLERQEWSAGMWWGRGESPWDSDGYLSILDNQVHDNVFFFNSFIMSSFILMLCSNLSPLKVISGFASHFSPLCEM